MNLKPIGERVLIKPKEESVTKGGIYIPEAAKEAKKEGEVMAVGNLKDNKPFPVEVGDAVIYGGYSSEDVEIDGKKYVFVELKDVLAKVRR